MKTALSTALAFAGMLASSQAGIFEIHYPMLSGLVPDGDLNGRADVRTISGVPGKITDVVVFLDLEGTGLDGGWNGDLYASLQHESALTILLNRPGRGTGDEYGSSGNGLQITLDDDAANGDVHWAPDGNVALQGAWAPDGRNVSPVASLGDFDSASRSSLLADFVGLPVEGDWTLFLMDASSGGQVEWKEWGLRITYDPTVTPPVIPEGSSWWVMGGTLLLVASRGLATRGVKTSKTSA